MLLFEDMVQNGILRLRLGGKKFFSHVNADIISLDIKVETSKYNCIFKCRDHEMLLVCESSTVRIYKSIRKWPNMERKREGVRREGERKREQEWAEKKQDGVLHN